tara:strand:- start:1912 stop:2526 length:615 start_codon:yes stop_codon:yes gene_type:complete
MNKIPNILTTFRIFIIPIMVIAFYVPGIFANVIAAILFAVAAITDYFDGYFARSLNAESNFGKCLDPIADKLIVIVAIILIISFGNKNPIIMIPGIIIVCREVLVSGLREFLAEFKVSVPVSKLAKYKTGFQMVSITILLLGEEGSAFIIYYVFGSLMTISVKVMVVSFIVNVGVILFVLSSILTIITGYGYFKAGVQKFNPEN